MTSELIVVVLILFIAALYAIPAWCERKRTRDFYDALNSVPPSAALKFLTETKRTITKNKH